MYGLFVILNHPVPRFNENPGVYVFNTEREAAIFALDSLEEIKAVKEVDGEWFDEGDVSCGVDPVEALELWAEGLEPSEYCHIYKAVDKR